MFAHKKRMAVMITVGRRPTFAREALSSALEDFTSVFGMGTGGSPPAWPPGFINNNKFLVKLATRLIR